MQPFTASRPSRRPHRPALAGLLAAVLATTLQAAAPAPGLAGGPPAHAPGPRPPAHARGYDVCSILTFVQARLEAAYDRPATFRRGRGLARLVESFNRAVDDRCVALNEIQVVGTHNSYHLPPRPALLQLFAQIDPAALEWEYDNLPLYEQFDTQAIRQIELDVFADPEGGLYADRLTLQLIGQDVASGEPALDEPGFKVLHVQHTDFETTCLTFVACLEEVKAWSDANPRHVPIMILVEAKDEGFFEPTLPTPVFIGSDELRALEDEIRSVFPEDRIVKPDDVRGDHASLEEAITTDGWPRLGAVRGKVMFALDNGGKRDLYVDGDPSLAGRLIFPNALPGQPDAGFVKVNDPLSDPTLIRDLVLEGYIVRTRADAGLQEARDGDTTRRDIALASGAQFVSTDFPDPSTIVSLDPTRPFDPTYEVELPEGGAARCNPVTAPDSCRTAALE
jgi:hypothetical protein